MILGELTKYNVLYGPNCYHQNVMLLYDITISGE